MILCHLISVSLLLLKNLKKFLFGSIIKDTILPQYNEIRNEKTYINDTINQMNINHGLDNYSYFTGINIILKPLF